ATQNGQNGGDLNPPAGHAYVGLRGGTGGTGSARYPQVTTASLTPTNFPNSGSQAFSAATASGGGGGGYNGPGGIGARPRPPPLTPPPPPPADRRSDERGRRCVQPASVPDQSSAQLLVADPLPGRRLGRRRRRQHAALRLLVPVAWIVEHLQPVVCRR